MKKTEVKPRHKFWKGFFRFILKPYFKFHYKFSAKNEKIKDIGPCLILFNHTNNIDPILASLYFDVPIYFMASEQIFNLGFVTKIITYLVNPISKSKSLTDISSVKQTIKIISEGGAVGIFPEGNCTYDGKNVTIPKAISKLVSHLKVPVIFYHLEGLYFSDPRWSIYHKKGSSSGHIHKIIYKEDYANLTDDELYKFICENLQVNSYDKKITKPFSGKAIGEGLNRLIFICPHCHNPHHMKSNNDEIICNNCGFVGKYNGFGQLEFDNKKYTLVEMNKMVRENIIEIIKKEPNISALFTDDIEIQHTYKTHKENIGKGQIAINLDGITIVCNNETMLHTYSNILSAAIQGKKKLIIYLENKPTLLLTLDEKVSPYKYLLAYQLFDHLSKNKNLDDVTYQDIGL